MGEFLQYGYIGQPRSIYRSVNKLPPGCWLHLDADGEPRIERYWSLADIVSRGPLTGSERDLEAELEALLIDAFKYRLVSDVPVGLFLSGGVDSSLVAGLLTSAGVDIETFTIGFKLASHDESGAAAAVSRSLGLANHVEIIDETHAASVLERWADLYDEPFGDVSGIPTFLVSSMARRRVAVALSADGGDELFCGYAGYSEAAGRMNAHGRLPGWTRAAVAQGLEAITATGVTGVLGGLASDRLYKLQGYLGASGLDALRPFRSFWQLGELRQLLTIPYTDPRRGALTWDGAPHEQLAALDFHEFLPDDVLAKADRASMAVGLECREPLLDHRIIEMAFRLPLSMRLGPLGNKHVLRNILYRYVPRALVDRPKQGFAVPLSNWMDGLIESGAMRESLAMLARKLGCERDGLESALAAFRTSDQGKSRLWLLHVLAKWVHRWA
jgi:asparagine synthase (glutamine-hydrolysing)